jgi:hypothetical protein
MPSKEQGFVLRFAVGDKGGVRSALWRVWKDEGKDDIYVAPSGVTSDGNIAGIAKISLHESRKCTFGFTSQYQKKIGGSAAERSAITWERKEGPMEGFAAAVSILISSEFLSDQATPYEKDMYLIGTPKGNGAVIIDMLFTRVPAGQLMLLPHQRELCRLPLSKGESFVVIAGYCDDFDHSLFAKSTLPLHEKTKRLGGWQEPDVELDQLRGAVVRLDEFTKTLRIVDVGHRLVENPT